ncbi:MAG: carboxylesterase family protein [Terracidiphilus sp.]
MNWICRLQRLGFAAWISVAVALVQTTVVAAQDDPLVVKTSGGMVGGVARDGGGAKFLGIPFAQPPVGELRWHEPLTTKPWSGVRDANSYSAPCAQPDLGGWNRHDAETGQEDCLYLNVITPEWPVKKPLPVMFWIHGGANEGGTAMSPLYTDGKLPNHGVVLVSVNYRLGVFGFLAHPELTKESAHHGSGNYGLMDQILALKWVIENIAKFGGDAKNITVFGQSAGAIDTGMLMASPAKGLFQKAIQESGAVSTVTTEPLTVAEAAGKRFATAMGAPEGTGQIGYLRGISAGEMIRRLTAHEPHQRFGPDVDGWVLTRTPGEVFAAGEESAIPLLFGTTTREFESTDSANELRATITRMSGALAPRALNAYGLADGGIGTSDQLYGTAADQFAADTMFRCPATAEGRWHESAHHPTYEYEFDHAVPGQPAAIHSTDLSYVFGFYPKVGNLAGAYSDIDSTISDMVESYFTNFAKTGNPNGAGLPNWTEFGPTATYVQITQDGRIATANSLREPVCKVYREVLESRRKEKK